VVTSAIVWDGQTVVLGGLISEDIRKVRDKVPFLGDIRGSAASSGPRARRRQEEPDDFHYPNPHRSGRQPGPHAGQPALRPERASDQKQAVK
jgi:hypothetical protein